VFAVGPNNEPQRVRLYVHPVEDHWAAMIARKDAPAPAPGTLTESTFVGATLEEAEREPKDYLGVSEPVP
jgi:hypothetical protein